MASPSYIRVTDPVALLDAAEKLATERDTGWRVHNRVSIGEDQGLAVLFLPQEGPILEPGFLLHHFGDKPGELQLTLSARSWRDGKHFPNEEDYRELENKAWKLIREAGYTLGLRLRLRHPACKPNPLRGNLREVFDRFVLVATNIWTGQLCTYIDSRDEHVWHDFIRLAHAYCSVLSEEDVSYHLWRAGFGEELVKEATHQYVIGRRILSGRLYPWQARKELKDFRKRYHEREEAELAQYRQSVSPIRNGVDMEVEG